MKDLHLKFRMEFGISHLREIEADYETDRLGRKVSVNIYPDDVKQLNIPTDEYICWLEDLAEKYFKQNLSRFSKAQLEDEIHRRKLRELNKLLAIERNKQNPLQ